MISKKRILLLLSIIFLTVTQSLFISQAEIDPIVNGDFETGDITGWTALGTRFDGGVTSQQAHSGKYCLLLRGIDYIEQAFNPPIISTSNLTFWAKTDGLAGEANITIGYADGIENTIQFGGSELTLEWKLFTVSVDQIQQIKRIQFSTWETDSIFIDDVSFSNQITIVSKIDIITTPITESVSKLESISKSINNDSESVIPGFMVIPTLIGLVVIVLIVRKRRI